MPLKMILITALAESSSQQPVDTETLCKGRNHEHVKAALMELYAVHVVCCCKIIKGTVERVVWWKVAEYGAIAAPRSQYTEPVTIKRNSEYLASLRGEVVALVAATPGKTQPEIIKALAKPNEDTGRCRNAISNLVQSKLIRVEGYPKSYRYYPMLAA